jgi:CBS domain-containing protein
VLRDIRVREIMSSGAPHVTFAPGTSTPEMLRRTRTSATFDIVPVLGADGKISGVVTPGNLRLLSEEKSDAGWAIASDVMQAAVTVRPDADLRTAAELMVHHRLRVLLVVDSENRIIGVLDESEIAKVYLRAAARADDNTQEIVLQNVGAPVHVEQPVADTTEKQPTEVLLPEQRPAGDPKADKN